jgi:hypothetical protein
MAGKSLRLDDCSTGALPARPSHGRIASPDHPPETLPRAAALGCVEYMGWRLPSKRSNAGLKVC